MSDFDTSTAYDPLDADMEESPGRGDREAIRWDGKRVVWLSQAAKNAADHIVASKDYPTIKSQQQLARRALNCLLKELRANGDTAPGADAFLAQWEAQEIDDRIAVERNLVERARGYATAVGTTRAQRHEYAMWCQATVSKLGDDELREEFARWTRMLGS